MKRGFTLIELLVVVAIIGILSSIVLASLNSARAKGADAAVKSNLRNALTYSGIYYDNNGNNYGGLCTDPGILAGLSAAKGAVGMTTATALIGTAGSATVAACHVAADNSSFAIEVPLKADSANAWCVDSNGASRSIAVASFTANLSACP